MKLNIWRWRIYTRACAGYLDWWVVYQDDDCRRWLVALGHDVNMETYVPEYSCEFHPEDYMTWELIS